MDEKKIGEKLEIADKPRWTKPIIYSAPPNYAVYWFLAPKDGMSTPVFKFQLTPDGYLRNATKPGHDQEVVE